MTDTPRIHEGTTVSVNDKMNAVHANVLREDGVLLRTCDCGVQHPVGDVNLVAVPAKVADWHRDSGCCARQCCAAWVTP